MGPEFLVAGIVFLQRFLLGVGLTAPRDNEDRCERKNRSIESRFQRVTPMQHYHFEGFDRRTFRSSRGLKILASLNSCNSSRTYSNKFLQQIVCARRMPNKS